ncbi:MAG: type II toxin-antitoxin system VapC family toxin [Acidobacteriota bacterium]
MVLDSSALVAILKEEPNYQTLLGKIDEADAILIGAPTLVETAIVLSRQTGKDQRPFLEAFVRRIDAQVIDFTEHHYYLAADALIRYGRGFNSQSNLNYGDCLVYAVAALAGDTLLFVGDDFTHTDIAAA